MKQIPCEAIRLDGDHSSIYDALLLISYVLLSACGSGVVVGIPLIAICNYYKISQTFGAIMPILYSIVILFVLLHTYYLRGPRRVNVFVDKLGIYVRKHGKVTEKLYWSNFKGVHTVGMFGIGSGGESRLAFPSLFWPPSVYLKFEGGKEIEICNIFNAKGDILAFGLDELFERLYKLNEGHRVFVEGILEQYPILEVQMYSKWAECPVQTLTTVSSCAKTQGLSSQRSGQRLDFPHTVARNVTVTGIYIGFLLSISIAIAYCIGSLLLNLPDLGLYAVLFLVVVYPAFVALNLGKHYRLCPTSIYVNPEGIIAIHRDGVVGNFTWDDLVEIRAVAMWCGFKDILAALLFWPPSLTVKFRDGQHLLLYCVFNGVECMAINGVGIFTIFPKLYRLSGRNAEVLRMIHEVCPKSGKFLIDE